MKKERELTRRHFLVEVAALGGTAAFLSACARGASGAMPRAANGNAARAVRPAANAIGLQLYTIGDQMRSDFNGALEKVANVGYKHVEFAGYFNKPAAEVRATLDRLKLRSPSTHIGMDLLRRDLEAQMSYAEIVGHEYITIPSLGRTETPMTTVDAWQRIADECNTMGQKVRARGLKLAFHSHSAEFVTVGEGTTGMDVFVRETDPAVFNFQLDLGWARFAGQDPVAWFKRYPNRFRMWHVKDIDSLAVAQKGKPTAVGTGAVDFKPILAAWKDSGLEYFFVEHDGASSWPGGSIAAIKTSFENLRTLLD